MLDYTNAFVRQKSLADNEISKEKEHLRSFSKELADLGAIRNRPGDDDVSCFKCGFRFNVQEIRTTVDRSGLDFMEAGWLVHAKHHPWCKLLEHVDQSTLDTILGKKEIIWLI